MSMTKISVEDYYTRCEYIWVKDHGSFNVLGYTWARLSDGSRCIVKNPVLGLPIKIIKHKPLMLQDVDSQKIIVKPWREEAFEIDYSELTGL